MMSPDERAYWERRRLEGRLTMREIAPVKAQLEKLKKSYDEAFCRAYVKYANADEMLAREDGRHKVLRPAGVTRQRKTVHETTLEELLSSLSRDQIMRLKEALEEEIDETS